MFYDDAFLGRYVHRMKHPVDDTWIILPIIMPPKSLDYLSLCVWPCPRNFQGHFEQILYINKNTLVVTIFGIHVYSKWIYTINGSDLG